MTPRCRTRVDREPRPGVRAAAAAPRPLERGRRRGRHDSSVEIEGEGADELPRDATHLDAARVRALRAARGLSLPLHQPHPARARPRLERRGDRARARRRCRGRRAARRRDRRATHARRAVRGPRRQPRGRRSTAASASPGSGTATSARAAHRGRHAGHADPCRPVAAHEHRRRRATDCRSRSSTTTPPKNAGAATLLGAAIVAGDAELLRDALPRPPARAVPARRRAASSRSSSRTRPAGTVGVTLSGSGPSVVVWADAGPGGGRRGRARAFPLRRHEGAAAARWPRKEPTRMSVYDRTHPAKRHSAALTDGVDRAPARAMLKGVGFTDDDLAKPLIGVATRCGSRRCRAT